MKLSLAIVLIFLNLFAEAQVKEFVVIDSRTKEPLNAVSTFFSASNEGSVTNADGKVKIHFVNNTDSLLFTHVGYNPKKIVLKDYLNVDTIRLTPSSILLKEVAVYSLDLKKKLAELLKNYHNLYPSQPVIYDCTYKESFKVNDSLARLAQVQLKWYDKNYRFDFSKHYIKQNQISLTTIDYSKVAMRDSNTSKKSNLANSVLFNLLHLNFYTYVLKKGSDLSIQSVDEYPNYTKVIFSTPIVVNGRIAMFLNDGIIYFDNESGAIIEIDFNYEYNNHSATFTSNKDKTPYTSKTKRHHVHLTFNKLNDNKWGIGTLKSEIEGEYIIGNKTESFQSTQEFLVTNTKKGGQIPVKDQIDLTKPFYENLPLYKNLASKILLTKAEEEFINKK
jgi:hypothetical protein